MTESEAGRKEKQRRVGESEEKERKEERRKEKCEDEGDGKSKVKPVTEWAGICMMRRILSRSSTLSFIKTRFNAPVRQGSPQWFGRQRK